MASVLRFTVDRGQIAGLASPGQPIHRTWISLLARIDARAKQNLSGGMVKVRTGNLRSSQFSRIESAGMIVRGTLENRASYARYVHDGTRPHEISARNATVLRFPGHDGQPVFRAVVHHPGTRPRPFLLEAMIRELGGGLAAGVA